MRNVSDSCHTSVPGVSHVAPVSLSLGDEGGRVGDPLGGRRGTAHHVEGAVVNVPGIGNDTVSPKRGDERMGRM